MNKKVWFKSASIRALKTMAQTAIATIGTSSVISDIDFRIVISSTILSGILSILTSIAGLPEVKLDNALNYSEVETDENSDESNTDELEGLEGVDYE